eukprot:m.44782 g.44782  ORF g.44782 m.44782 type:complete len:1069 (+) comp11735_c0_seq1:335-3541(+)
MPPKRKAVDNDVGAGPASASSVASEFQEGAVVRVKLKNFVTYTDVEVYPGPNLNVVIGPNGTGKSTLVCAICLGLAGSTTLLGRQKKVGDFVRSGSEFAEIDVELFRSNGPNMVVHRRFTKDNKSAWSVNGKTCTEGKVKEHVRELDVQIDNLCQFLPQDMVPEFARMNPVQLLIQTEKAVGGQKMAEQHKELIELAADESKMRVDKEDKESFLGKLKEQNAFLEPDIERHKQREQQRTTIHILKMKKPWVQYEDTRKQYLLAKEDKKKADERLEAAKKEAGPLQAEVDELKKQVGILDRLKKQRQAVANKGHKLVQKKHAEFEKKKLEAEELEAEMSAASGARKKLETKLRQYQADIAKLEEQLKGASDDTAPLEAEKEALRAKKKQTSDKIWELQNARKRVRQSLMPLQDQVKERQHELSHLENMAAQRLAELKRRRPDSWKAVQWLRENQDKFEKEILEPMSLVMTIKDRADAMFVEASVPANALDTFIAQTESDHDKLNKLVRDEQRLRINTGCDPAPGKAVSAYKPRFPLRDIAQYGFNRHVIDMVDAPDAQKRYICHFHKVHDIPAGTDEVSKHTDDLSQLGLGMYFEPRRRVTMMRSKFGRQERLLSTTPLRGARIFNVQVDTARRDEVQRELRDIKRDFGSLNDQDKQYTAEEQVARQEMARIEARGKELSALIRARQMLQQKLTSAKERLDRTTAVLTQHGRQVERTQAKYKNIRTVLAQLLIQVFDAFKPMEEHSAAVTSILLETLELRAKIQTKESTLSASLDEIRTLTSQRQQKDVVVKELRSSARQHLQAARRATNTNEGEELSTELTNSFKFVPNTLEEIEEQLAQEEARLACQAEVNEEVIQEYEQRCLEIAEKENELADFSEQYQEKLGRMEALKQEWLPHLKDLVSRIATSYTEFFARLDCVGQVSLREEGTDFEKYGIEIRVKFRHNEPLQLLTAHHQSGGERSVSTMLYLMALQALTKCPFRVVDEINQGMDPTNERRVFSQVVHCSSNTATSQYFLVTPKLLPDLEYNDKLRVLCVFNGPYMLSYTDWDLEAAIKSREERSKRAKPAT